MKNPSKNTYKEVTEAVMKNGQPRRSPDWNAELRKADIKRELADRQTKAKRRRSLCSRTSPPACRTHPPCFPPNYSWRVASVTESRQSEAGPRLPHRLCAFSTLTLVQFTRGGGVVKDRGAETPEHKLAMPSFIEI